LHQRSFAAYSLANEIKGRLAMANKEQKRSSREAKKPKQKKKGGSKSAAAKTAGK